METLQFKTEMKQLMDIIVNSLYSKKEIFLRELISNASDAIDKVRFESIQDAAIAEDNTDWKIKLVVDNEANTLTVSDNGIGMNHEDVIENLGTIARSGTRQFIENLNRAKEEDRPDLIGQFGVGFYASFMVAKKVTVVTRRAGSPGEGVTWESDGSGEFTVEPCEKATRGTDVIIHLKDDEKEFLSDWRLRSLVHQFSDFIEHPVTMDVERTEGEDDDKKTVIEEETLNSRKAIWLRSPSDVSEEEYNEFYKHLTHDHANPAHAIHYNVEGSQEFRALMYIPAQKPAFLFQNETKYGPSLYIRRVFIKDNCDTLLPPYLQFVKGVVDSADLPLNVSREMLQNNAMLERIKRNLTGKILKTLGDLKENENDKYTAIYKEFGPILKMGVYTDFEQRDRLANLLMFESTATENGVFTTLKDYVERMPEDQKDIYFLAGEARDKLAISPYLEVFKKRGHEVLFMTDPIDEWVVQGLNEYEEKPFKAVDKGEIEATETEKIQAQEAQEKYSDLLSALAAKLPDVKEVRLSTRLTDSASCLVVDDAAMGAHLEKLLRQLDQESVPQSARILELNPEHPAVEALQNIFNANGEDQRIEDWGRLLYDQAVMAEGTMVSDPVAFAKRVNDLMVQVAKA